MNVFWGWLDCSSTRFRLASGVIRTAGCWLVVCASCCHLLAVSLSVWLASCSILHNNHRNPSVLKRAGMFSSSARWSCLAAGLQKNYEPDLNSVWWKGAAQEEPFPKLSLTLNISHFFLRTLGFGLGGLNVRNVNIQ